MGYRGAIVRATAKWSALLATSLLLIIALTARSAQAQGLSHDQNNPTPVAATVGSNPVVFTGSNGQSPEFIRITVPAGQRLVAINVTQISSTWSLAMRPGLVFSSAPPVPGFTDILPNQLLTDVLDNLGTPQPPVVTGFVPPLPAGTYSFATNDDTLSNGSNLTLAFVLAPAVPALPVGGVGLAALLLGVMGLALVHVGRRSVANQRCS